MCSCCIRACRGQAIWAPSGTCDPKPSQQKTFFIKKRFCLHLIFLTRQFPFFQKKQSKEKRRKMCYLCE